MNNIIKRTWNQGSMVNIEDLRGMTFQAESGGHTFVISAVDADGNAVAMSGTPAGTMLRPDNTDQALTCSISGGNVYATLPAGCYDVPGRAGITIFLTSGGQKAAIYAAVVSVTRTQSGTASPGTTASVVDLINAINTAISGIPATDTALKAAMAPTYSNSALYAVGDYAWYNGTLYRCTTAITTAETWTSGHWTTAAIGTDSANELRGLKSALSADMFAERYVEYNSLTPYSFAANANRPAFSRYGNRFTFNGTFGSSSNQLVKLSEAGTSNTTTSRNTAKGWDKAVQFLSGHTYRAKLTLLSGSYSGGEDSYVRVNLFTSDSTERNVYFDGLVFTPGEVTSNVVFETVGGESFTNAVFTFTIEDITDLSLVTDAKTVNGAIGELDGLIAKCLTGDYEEATVIPDNSDLNDYTTAGNYRISGNSDLTTISNLPHNRAGRLFVIHPYNQRLLQLFFDPYERAIWVRRYTTDWSAWAYVLTSATITSTPIKDSGYPITSDGVFNALEKQPKSTMGLAYSWWCNNRATDSYGNLYFGYISKGEKVGVGCRYPDGTIVRKDLFASEDCDDHNAPSVIILVIDGAEYVCVIGSTGHNTDNKINVYVATEPNSILCDFTDRTKTITEPEGYSFRCSYSQAYFDTSGSYIYNFFRLRQYNRTTLKHHMVWMCAISDDFGETWSIYRVFTITDDGNGGNGDEVLFYMWSSDYSTNTWLKRVVLQKNTTYAATKPISAGFVNPKTLNILDANGHDINKPMTLLDEGEPAYDTSITIADYNDFTTIIPVDEMHRYRILDVWDSGLNFLYVKSVESIEDHRNITDWILYCYKGGTVTEIAHLGLPFFKGSCYVTGANFIGDINHIVYSKNDSSQRDGEHSLHYVTMNGNTISSDEIIKWSSDTIARPMRYDDGCVMYLKGKYRENATGEESYNTWHFGIGFIDHV